VSPDLRSRYLELIDRKFGIRESDYGSSRIDHAVTSVLPRTTCADPERLFDLLDSGARTDWLDLIVEHLTVGETYFLRDPAQIAALRGTILPAIVKRRGTDRRVRMWSAGCSTGEEPYTLAILLREQAVLDEWEALIVGTDVNRESLRVAREARYPAWSFRATSEAFKQRYFDAVGNGWRLKEPVRRMVRFGWSNLAADPLLAPSADFDLIVCRNVTIYFDDAATQRLYRTLIGSLAPGGWLMLGPSDPMPAERDALERVDVHNAVVWRRLAPDQPQAAPRPLPRPVSQPRLPQPLKPARSGSQPWVSSVKSVTPTPAGPVVTPAARTVPADGHAELEAGLLALEAGSATSALEWLRRATFRDPQSPLGQFALARAYLGVGDTARAFAALQHTQRLLSELRGEEFVPHSDAMPIETLRQAVQTHLTAMEAA
jgi:chemotaxis protein methyltransferase CheR